MKKRGFEEIVLGALQAATDGGVAPKENTASEAELSQVNGGASRQITKVERRIVNSPSVDDRFADFFQNFAPTERGPLIGGIFDPGPSFMEFGPEPDFLEGTPPQFMEFTVPDFVEAVPPDQRGPIGPQFWNVNGLR